MSTYTTETTDSSGRRYVSEFDSRFTGPIRQWTYRADGTLEYEYDTAIGQGRGTTDPAGLKPLLPITIDSPSTP